MLDIFDRHAPNDKMPQSNKRFPKIIIIIVLIVQVLLTALVTHAEAGVIKKREIPAPNDPDIVVVSDGDSSELKWKTADGGIASKNESENMASTKLLPQVSGDSMEEFKSSKKFNMFEVKEKTQEQPLLDVPPIKKLESEGITVQHTRKNESLPLTTESNQLQEHTEQTDESIVFSHKTEAATNGQNETAVSNNVNDGLDALAMKAEDTLISNDNNTTISTPTVVPTTEEILTELEETALKVQPSNLTVTASDESLPTVLVPSKSDFGRSMLHSEENMLQDRLEASTVLPEIIAVKLAEQTQAPPPTANADYSETTTVTPTDLKRIETTTMNATLPDLITRTATTERSIPNENAVEQMQAGTTPTTLIATTTFIPPILPQADNASLALQSHENVVEESNEIRASAPHPTGQISSEKRGKFIDDNSTNAQQLNLPDAAEVWTLAGMKSVPKSNVTMMAEKRITEILLNTEKTTNNSAVSSNSEKNLLDWTQIMKNGDLDTKKYDNHVEGNNLTQIQLFDDKLLSKNDTATMPPKFNELLNNRTELLKNSPVYTVDAKEPVKNELTATTEVTTSSSTLLLNVINENSIETTTVATATELSNIKPDLQKTITTSTEVPPTPPPTTLATVNADNNTTTKTTLSTDNIDSGGSSATEAPKETLPQSVTTLEYTSSNDKIESKLLEMTAATPTTNSVDEHDSAAEALDSTIRLTPPPPPVASNASNNEMTQNANKNNNGRDDSPPTLELSSTETTTLSTLEASEVNTTTAADGRNSTNFTHSGILQIEKDVGETTTSTTEFTTTTVLPIILTTKNTQPNSTTEIGQINNEVDLDIKIIGSSTSKTTHSEVDSSETDSPTIKTTSSTSDDLLIKETITKTTTAATPIQVLATSTASSTTGSVLGVDDNPTTEATPAVIDANIFDTKAKQATNSASHESESSIETNVIDPLDKSTAPSTDKESENKTDVKETTLPTLSEAIADKEHNEDILLAQATTTMGTFTLGMTTTTTTTEPPLISLLDDSTSTTPTTPVIGTKIEEVYSVFPSTTTTTTSTEGVTTAITIISSTPAPTQLPINTTTSAMIVPKLDEASSAPAAATTLFPHPVSVLHASIGSDMTAAPALMPPGMGSGNLHPNSADASSGGGTDVNVIIAISVSVIGVVALILLVAFLYLMRKRQKQMSYGQRCRPVSLDAYSLDNVSVLGSSVRRSKGALRASKRSYGNVAFDDPSLRHNALSASELGKFVERRSSIFEEFRDVPQIIARANEVPQGCEDKNRYANVIPLPETRVILQQQNDDEKTEYINANYVRGPKDAPNYYIACQAPLDLTVADFWRMIWEQQSRVIIQATDLIENGIEKCAEYLPPSVTLDNHTTYGDFQVTLKHREVKDKYAISTLMLRNTITETSPSRELTHYWYKWPETGVPGEEASIIAMLLEARSSLKSYAIEQANELKAEKSSTMTLKVDEVTAAATDVEKSEESMEKRDASSVSGASSSGSAGSNGTSVEINGNVSSEKLKAAARNQGPLTIHCSPGTGRTGTIISCDMAIRSLETPKRSVDIPQIVYYVRRGRASAVQTKEQYEFIYKVTNMYATKITNISNDN